MSPKNPRLECDRAVDLLMARDLELSDRDSDFLQHHLANCSGCSDQSQLINSTVHEMRSDVVYADPAMVRATQMRVRARAAEMRRQQETMRPLWISSALALGWAVVSMPLLWQGFAWFGGINHVPDMIWQTGFGVMALAPLAAVGTVGLASHMRHKTIS
jgi:predicted anti-sigma-YlaC factor YlaD